MNRKYLFIPFFLLMLRACMPTTAVTQMPSSPTSLPVIAPTPTTVEVDDKIVTFHIYEATGNGSQTKTGVGNIAEMQVSFKPVIYRVTRRHDGSVESTSSRIWEPHTITEMQICTSLDEPCQLDDKWIPFDVEQTFQVGVDWVGPRLFWVVAQFRDSSGKNALSIGQSHQNPEPVSQAAYSIVGIVDEAIPIEDLPLPIQTVVAATRIAFPVHGSIEIEGGRCCTGGMAGDTIQVSVAFEASSPHGKVEEMRTKTGRMCFTEDNMIENKWEPFVPAQAYPAQVASNWIGFYISVQYRDTQGNLSPVYCDDISVEGHVPSPSP